MKVLCVHAGKQDNPNPVVVGLIYTVEKVVDGWELMVDNKKKFYVLKEMPSNQVYATHLFAIMPNSVLDDVVSDANKTLITEKVKA